MSETSVQRAKRFAAESPARMGDPVLIGQETTIHRVARPSFIVAGWVRTFCDEGAKYQPVPDDPSIKRQHCDTCRTKWKMQAKLQELVSK